MGFALMCVDCDFSSYKRTFQVHPIVKTYPTALKIKGGAVLDNSKNQQKYSVSFDPLLTSYRGVKWTVESGAEYASIDNHGMLNAKFSADGAAHNVVIKATSTAVPSVSDTMTVSVKCNTISGVCSIAMPADFQYDGGRSFILQGLLDGEECSLIRFQPLVSLDTMPSKPANISDLVELKDNMDGTATVTIKSKEYIHQVQFRAYNDANGANNCTYVVNMNDFVIIDAADSENSRELVKAFHDNGKCASSEKMYMSEAYVITSI